MTMAELVPLLEANVDAPVADRTGLAGVYQFTLELPRDAMFDRFVAATRLRLGAGPSLSAPAGGMSGVKGIESLGLKLERRRVPVEVVVVDKISRTPTEN